MNNTFLRYQWPVMLTLLHTALVAWIAWHMHSHYRGPGYQEITQIWGLAAIIGFPSSYVSMEILWYLDAALLGVVSNRDQTNYVYLPMIVFGLLGGAQYYFLGWLISRAVLKRYSGERE